jgi:ribonuclease HI
LRNLANAWVLSLLGNVHPIWAFISAEDQRKLDRVVVECAAAVTGVRLFRINHQALRTRAGLRSIETCVRHNATELHAKIIADEEYYEVFYGRDENSRPWHRVLQYSAIHRSGNERILPKIKHKEKSSVYLNGEEHFGYKLEANPGERVYYCDGSTKPTPRSAWWSEYRNHIVKCPSESNAYVCEQIAVVSALHDIIQTQPRAALIYTDAKGLVDQLLAGTENSRSRMIAYLTQEANLHTTTRISWVPREGVSVAHDALRQDKLRVDETADFALNNKEIASFYRQFILEDRKKIQNFYYETREEECEFFMEQLVEESHSHGTHHDSTSVPSTLQTGSGCETPSYNYADLGGKTYKKVAPNEVEVEGKKYEVKHKEFNENNGCEECKIEGCWYRMENQRLWKH